MCTDQWSFYVPRYQYFLSEGIFNSLDDKFKNIQVEEAVFPTEIDEMNTADELRAQFLKRVKIQGRGNAFNCLFSIQPIWGNTIDSLLPCFHVPFWLSHILVYLFLFILLLS